MKDAHMMYKLAQEAKAEEKRADVINAITFAIGDTIQSHAKKGFTDIRISTDNMGFNNDFMLNLNNVHELMSHIKQFGYKVHLLVNEKTNEMILHIDWAPAPLEEIFESLGSVIQATARF